MARDRKKQKYQYFKHLWYYSFCMINMLNLKCGKFHTFYNYFIYDVDIRDKKTIYNISQKILLSNQIESLKCKYSYEREYCPFKSCQRF